MANADIFISYSRKDHELVAKLVYLLEWYGYTVWWDIESLRSGEDFSQVIKKAIDDVKCVIVLWSKHSVQSKWVRAEAQIAENADKILPVLKDSNTANFIPTPFNILHSESLDSWVGNPQNRQFHRLLEAVEHFCSQPSGQAFVSRMEDPQLAVSKSQNQSMFLALGWLIFGLLAGVTLGYGYFEFQASQKETGNRKELLQNVDSMESNHEEDVVPGAGRFTNNGDGTVTDKQTRLMWKTCSEGQVFDASDPFICPGLASAYSWSRANEKFVGGIEFLDYSDWRLPSKEELKSLVWCSNGTTPEDAGYGCDGKNGRLGGHDKPTIYQDYFPNTELKQYISSTITTFEDKAYHWVRGFNEGGMFGTLNPDITLGSVRLVRNIRNLDYKKKSSFLDLEGLKTINPSFEVGISGWQITKTNELDYIAEVTNGVSRLGNKSLYVASLSESPKSFHMIQHTNKEFLNDLLGKNVHVFSYVNIKDIFGGLEIRANLFSNKKNKVWNAKSATYSVEKIKEKNWLKYSLYFKYPNEVDNYNIVMELTGKGEMWIDDFGIEILEDDAEVDELQVSVWKSDK